MAPRNSTARRQPRGLSSRPAVSRIRCMRRPVSIVLQRCRVLRAAGRREPQAHRAVPVAVKVEVERRVAQPAVRQVRAAHLARAVEVPQVEPLVRAVVVPQGELPVRLDDRIGLREKLVKANEARW